MAEVKRTIVTLTELSTYQQFLRDNSVVILKAGAVWCGPCKMIQPLFDSEMRELPIEVSIVYLDVDKAPSISRRLSIRSVPCIISIINGQPDDVVVGANPAAVSKFFAKVRRRLGK